MSNRIIRQPNGDGKLENGFRVLQGKQEYVTYPDGSSFRIWYSDVPWLYEQHTHSAVEVVLTMDGVVEYEINGKAYSVRKGEVLFVPTGLIHGLNMEEGGKRFLFLFEPDAMNTMLDFKESMEYFRQPVFLQEGNEALPKIREKLMEITEIYHDQKLLWNTECYGIMLQIATILGREVLHLETPHYPRARSGVESEIISGALTYINNHYKDDLTLDDLADFAGFSRYYFSRSFKKEVGYSFKDYLNQKRLQVAMDLLIHTKRPIRDIAMESGFGSIASFNRAFRESKNCTPTQFRAIYGVY